MDGWSKGFRELLRFLLISNCSGWGPLGFLSILQLACSSSSSKYRPHVGEDWLEASYTRGLSYNLNLSDTFWLDFWLIFGRWRWRHRIHLCYEALKTSRWEKQRKLAVGLPPAPPWGQMPFFLNFPTDVMVLHGPTQLKRLQKGLLSDARGKSPQRSVKRRSLIRQSEILWRVVSKCIKINAFCTGRFPIMEAGANQLSAKHRF